MPEYKNNSIVHNFDAFAHSNLYNTADFGTQKVQQKSSQVQQPKE